MRTSALPCPRPVAILAPLALIAAGLVGFSATPAAAATTILVTTHADEVAANGACSLREAVANANTDALTFTDCAPGGGADTIRFGLAAPGVITLDPRLERIWLTDHVTVDGAGAVVSGGAAVGLVGVETGAVVVLDQLTFRHARGEGPDQGGAITNLGDLTVVDSVFDGNVAPSASGGAILSDGNLAVLTVSRSTFVGNRAPTGGALAVANGSTADVSHSTFVLNAATVGSGGAISARGKSTSISYATFSDNEAGTLGGAVQGAFSVSATVFEGNLASLGGTCDGGSDLGFNVSADGSCASDPTSLPMTSPGLGPAATNNGGPTPTIALPALSPAVDLIPAGHASCPATGALFDQRGFARPADGDLDGTSGCDAGAYERNASPPAVDNADLKVTLSGPTSARRGALVSYIATVTNTGPGTATDLVTVVGGAGLTVTATAPTTGTGSLKVGSTTLTGARWTTASLATGASLTFTLTAKVAARADQTVLVAAGTLATTPDPHLGTNLTARATRVVR